MRNTFSLSFLHIHQSFTFAHIFVIHGGVLLFNLLRCGLPMGFLYLQVCTYFAVFRMQIKIALFDHR